MKNWLDDVVTQLKRPGSQAALSFVEANYSTLAALNLDTVTEIITLLGTNQRQAALIKLETRITDPDVIIAYEKQNAGDCVAREKAWEDFKAGLENFALQLLPALLKVGASVATGGLTLCLVLCLCLTGCIWDNRAAPTTEQANILSGGYMQALEKTTGEQDKAHIRSMDAEILAVDGAVRGTKAAAETRALVAPATAPQTTGGGK